MFVGLQNLISTYYFIGITIFFKYKKLCTYIKDNFCTSVKRITRHVLKKKCLPTKKQTKQPNHFVQ